MAGQSLDYAQIAIDNLVSDGLLPNSGIASDPLVMVPLTAALFETESSGDISAVSPNKKNMGIGQIDEASAQTVRNRHPELKDYDIKTPEGNATLSAMNLIDGIMMQDGLRGGLEQYRGGAGSVGKNTKDKSFGEDANQYVDKYVTNFEKLMGDIKPTLEKAGQTLQARESLIAGQGKANLQQTAETSDLGVAINKAIADEAYAMTAETQKFLQRQAVTTGLYDTTLSKQAAATQKVANQQTELGNKYLAVYNQYENGNFLERWWAKNVDIPKLDREKEVLDSTSQVITASGTNIRNQLATNLTVADYRNKLQTEKAQVLTREAAKVDAQMQGDTTKQGLINTGINYLRDLYTGNTQMVRLQQEAARIQSRQQEWAMRKINDKDWSDVIETLSWAGRPGYTRTTLEKQPQKFIQYAAELTAAKESGVGLVGDFQHKLDVMQTLGIPQENWDIVSPGFSDSYQENEQAQQQVLTSPEGQTKYGTGITAAKASQYIGEVNDQRITNATENTIKTISQYADPEAVKEELANYSPELQDALISLGKSGGGTLDNSGQSVIVKSIIDYLKTNHETLTPSRIAQIVWPLLQLKTEQARLGMTRDLINVPDEFGLNLTFPQVKDGLLTDSVVQQKYKGVNGLEKFTPIVQSYLATKKTEAEIEANKKLIGGGGFR